jgi:hypothetical protein
MVLVCAGSSAAFAQEWKLSTNLSQRVLYSDNLLLNRSNEVDAFGFITTPELLLERTSPTSHIALNGQFQFAEYIDHSDFNSQDQIIDLDVEKALSERSRLGFDANFTRDTTLTSEEDITNRFLDDAIRFISWRTTPSWSYDLTPLDQIGLAATYRAVTYSDTDEKTDYQYFGPAINYSRRLSELSKFTTELTARRFIPDEPGDDYTDTIGTLFGYAYDPSERFSISGGLGVSYSEEHDEGEGSDSDVGYRLKFDMKYLVTEQLTARASLSHDNEPSGDGDQVTRNRVRVGLDYRATEMMTLGFDLNYADNVDVLGFEGQSTDDEDERSRYVAVRPSIGYRFTEDLSLVGSYQFRYKKFEDENDTATSNSVFLTLQYNFPTWAGTGF